MNIDEIATAMVGEIIEAADVVYGNDSLTLYLSSGMSVEIIVDSIFADIPELDD